MMDLFNMEFQYSSLLLKYLQVRKKHFWENHITYL